MNKLQRHEWYSIIARMNDFQIFLLAETPWPKPNKRPDYLRDDDIISAILDRYSLIPIHVRDSIMAALVHM